MKEEGAEEDGCKKYLFDGLGEAIYLPLSVVLTNAFKLLSTLLYKAQLHSCSQNP